ncbi:uncharacterized protein V6R79_019316 [Siganus canaliculatus]
MFVGFLQQPGGGPCFLGQWDPEELSSLHSSPSPIHRHPFGASTSPTDPAKPLHDDIDPELYLEPPESDHEDPDYNMESRKPLLPRELDFSPLKPKDASHEQIQSLQLSLKESPDTTRQPQDPLHWGSNQSPAETPEKELPSRPPEAAGTTRQQRGRPSEQHFHVSNQREQLSSSSDSWLSSPELDQTHKERKSSSTCSNGPSRVTTHNNNNHIRLKDSEKDKRSTSPPSQARMQLFALYNHTGELNTSSRFYSLRVPLQVQKEAGLITEVDTHWLDHLTQHFTSGAHLIDGFFHLEDTNDNGLSSVDSVFILQSSAEEAVNISYDAIVVEQWTVVDGVVVKTDYVPLLQSLAPYGWRLMCVLPTPIVKTNSDGSLSTKQILFLQRPILQRKRKDFKMLNLRGRSKTKKKSTGEEQEERENRSPAMETEMDTFTRNRKEEEHEAESRRKSGDSGRSEGASPRKGGDEYDEDAPHQKAFMFLSGSRASVGEQEEETNVDEMPPCERQRSVRWTDVCQRDDGGAVKEEVKTEERIRQQLFSGVC